MQGVVTLVYPPLGCCRKTRPRYLKGMSTDGFDLGPIRLGFPYSDSVQTRLPVLAPRFRGGFRGGLSRRNSRLASKFFEARRNNRAGAHDVPRCEIGGGRFGLEFLSKNCVGLFERSFEDGCQTF